MKLESLDLNLLLVFDALATERSVTQAAAKVGLEPTRLEQRARPAAALFRDPLFERSAGQMQPTPRARQLLVPFSEAISKLREALETQAGFANASPPRARRSPDYRFFLRETISPVLGGKPRANPTTP